MHEEICFLWIFNLTANVWVAYSIIIRNASTSVHSATLALLKECVNWKFQECVFVATKYGKVRHKIVPTTWDLWENVSAMMAKTWILLQKMVICFDLDYLSSVKHNLWKKKGNWWRFFCVKSYFGINSIPFHSVAQLNNFIWSPETRLFKVFRDAKRMPTMR